MYGVFIKADTKATIWYSPKVFKARGWKPLTASSKWSDLVALTDEIRKAGMAPWSMGMEAGAGSGFPGSDWIQQILLNEQDPLLYDDLADNAARFTDPRVKDAWQKFGQIALTPGNTVQGNAASINATSFVDATYPPFESTPRAAMTYLGGFASGFIAKQFPAAKAGEDYDFFPFPGGRVTGGASIGYAFKKDAGTADLMKYLVSTDAQQIWVRRGGFTSLARSAQAKQLLSAPAFKFDLDDALGGDFQTTYFRGVGEYLADPSKLDSILQGIEAARRKS
jgi:alpha-glucoside transport system substrate-binding protein